MPSSYGPALGLHNLLVGFRATGSAWNRAHFRTIEVGSVSSIKLSKPSEQNSPHIPTVAEALTGSTAAISRVMAALYRHGHRAQGFGDGRALYWKHVELWTHWCCSTLIAGSRPIVSQKCWIPNLQTFSSFHTEGWTRIKVHVVSVGQGAPEGWISLRALEPETSSLLEGSPNQYLPIGSLVVHFWDYRIGF